MTWPRLYVVMVPLDHIIWVKLKLMQEINDNKNHDNAFVRRKYKSPVIPKGPWMGCGCSDIFFADSLN